MSKTRPTPCSDYPSEVIYQQLISVCQKIDRYFKTKKEEKEEKDG